MSMHMSNIYFIINVSQSWCSKINQLKNNNEGAKSKFTFLLKHNSTTYTLNYHLMRGYYTTNHQTIIVDCFPFTPDQFNNT